MTTAAARPKMPNTPADTRQPIRVVPNATMAGSATFPRSPAKLYVPSAARRAPVSYALDTIVDDSGCWTPDASPATSSKRPRVDESSRPARHHEDGCRDRSADRQHPPFAEALGQEAGRDLKDGHAAAIERPEESDLGERERELGRPDRQQDVDDIGEAVVQKMSSARHREDGLTGTLHRPIMARRSRPFK